MNVSVRLFAVLRERAGRSTMVLDLNDGATVADAVKVLRQDSKLGPALRHGAFVTAVNRVYADDRHVLAAGDEVALIPPVSGGGEPHVVVKRESLDAEAVNRLVRDPAAGAVVTFQGVTREVAALDYEAYVEMAGERISGIVAEAIARHGLCAAAAEHRVGRVSLGEPSVVVAVSAPHRKEAFRGAAEIIDRIKAEAPVWKREVDASGGADWVEGTLPPTS